MTDKKTIHMKEDFIDHWTSPTLVVRSIGPKLVPFFKTVAIYLVLADRESPSWLTCLLKCLPIIWLCIFVILHGMSLGEEHVYSRRILIGLVLSCIGDALLVWPQCFIWGMLSFALAHISYIIAFGFYPFNVNSGVIFGLIGAMVHYIMYPKLIGTVFSIAVPVYNVLLLTMVWRAVARVEGFFQDLWTWTKLCSCFGGILFAISDTLLGLREFGLITHMMTGAQWQLLVMSTYYSAQFGIALSVVDRSAMAALSATTDSHLRFT
ncbi:lysoplasmalogenase-like protein TMEM86A [Oppia nitens]|uniref:lysoplasmalogenase-like protein TMEM86A n=1 Tax=Oppia nitens TaxID=1686743 RepID=UPI0023DA82B4|nr:lysoplasmalogenase-like protein TMEM86A [Oppia nitens]